MKKIIGIKKVADATKTIEAGYKGYVRYNFETNFVSYDGVWGEHCSITVEKDSSEHIFWVYKPMTMREITKMIAKVVDYDAYIKMDLEDTIY